VVAPGPGPAVGLSEADVAGPDGADVAGPDGAEVDGAGLDAELDGPAAGEVSEPGDDELAD
jgi:hypothetical protein